MNRRKTLGIAAAGGLTVIGLTLSALAFRNTIPFQAATRADAYHLTLNSSNGIDTNNYTGDRAVSTDNHQAEVEFSYSNCSALSGGHAVINAGGSLVNKDHIRSIYELVAVFSTSGALKFRSSYDGQTWSGYTSMVSSQTYELGSNPYYIELTTDGSNAVNLTSVQFTYSCVVNPEAHEDQPSSDSYFEKVTSNRDDWEGTYLFVYEGSTNYAFDGSFNAETYGLDSYNNNLTVSISNNIIEANEGTIAAAVTVTSDGDDEYYLETTTNRYIGGVSGTNKLYNSTKKTSVNPSTINYTSSGIEVVSATSQLRFNTFEESKSSTGYANQFRYFRTGSSCVTSIQAYKLVEPEPIAQPIDEVGFIASDTNKDNYLDTTIFDESNGLVVQALYNDGTDKILDSSEYTYTIKNSSSQVINTAAAFGAEGQYTLTVSYKNYIDVVIPLNVGLYTYLTSIDASMTSTAFNSADILGNSISTLLTADLVFNASSKNKTINYGLFAENDIGVQLLNPNGVAASIDSPFGVAGTWTLKVYSLLDSTIKDTISLTVASIPVVDITLSDSELVLHVGGSAQLTATLNPVNATNQGISWSSSDSTIATVSSSGLVEAKKVGGPVTITATSSDGGYQATCSVTVKKAAVSTATITSNSTGGTNSASYTSTSFTCSGITIKSGSFTQVYNTDNGSFRMASNNNSGEITLNFDATVITGITVHAKVYDSNASVNVSTSANTSGETITVSEDGDYVTTAFASDTTESTSLTITNAKKNRFYLVGLTLTVGVVDPIYPTAITLSDATVNVGYTTQLTPKFSPADTNQKAVTWSSSNTSVATVDSTGLVTGVAAGTATITVTGKDEDDNDVVGTCTVTVTTVAVTGVSLNKTSSELSLGKTLTLEATVSPANATNKNINWSSSNTSVATVSAGTVTAKATGTATITATSASDSTKKATCTITVVEQQSDDYTIMIYMCGADLESDSGLATGDLKEILNVSGKPDGVNVIIETGGASKWNSTYGISSAYLERYEVTSSRTLSRKAQLTKASMGLSSTFQSFLEWGLTEYPADKTGVIMWNHGGAMDGVCFDENFSDNPLTNTETNTALNAAFTKVGRSTSDKLEWIGYDACLMAVQDVAEMNSKYFNYMVCSQETEGGYGWDYDRGWLKSIYNNPSINTETVLEQICTNFIADNSEESTLSVLRLTQMAAYKTAFENIASQLYNALKNSSTTWSALKTMVNKSKKFGYYSKLSSYNGGYVYDVFDVQDFITNGKTTYSSYSSYWTALQSAFDNVIVCSKYTSDYEGSHGMNLFCPICAYNEKTCYSESQTNFTTWRSLCISYGSWYN